MNKIKMKILMGLYYCIASCFMKVGRKIHDFGKYFFYKKGEIRRELEEDDYE